MANGYEFARFFSGVAYFNTFVRKSGNRFFQKNVVAPIESFQRMVAVLAVLRGYNQNVGKFFALQQRFGAVKTPALRHAVCIARKSHLFGYNVGNGDDFHSLGMQFRIFSVSVQSSSAKPYYSYRILLHCPLTVNNFMLTLIIYHRFLTLSIGFTKFS